jgi:retinol dehydrogenase 12
MFELIEAYKNVLIGLTSVVSFVLLTKKYYFGGATFNDDTNVRLENKTVIVTGSNTGIGKETAMEMAKRGARVILACRDKKRATEAAQDIRKATGNGNVIVKLVDLSSMESIRNFAQDINDNEERVDILINNAGLICPKWKTKDGYDMTFGVNHLGPFLLTNLLLDKLKQSKQGRIVNLASKGYASLFLLFQNEFNYKFNLHFVCFSG